MCPIKCDYGIDLYAEQICCHIEQLSNFIIFRVDKCDQKMNFPMPAKQINRIIKISFYNLPILLLLFFFQCVNNPSQMEPQNIVLNIERDTTIGPGDTLLLIIASPEKDPPYFWVFDNETVDTTYKSYYPVVWPVSDTGKHTVAVLTPDLHMYIPETLTITVRGIRPNVKIEGPSEAVTNDTTVFHVSGTDHDGFILTYMWSVDKRGDFWSSDTSDSLVATFPEAGPQTVRVRALDDDRLSSYTDSLQVNVVLKSLYAPEVEIEGPAEVDAKDSVIFYANGTDRDGSIEKYYWSTDKLGLLWFSDTSDSFVVMWNISEAGPQTVRVRAVDDDGLSSHIRFFAD